MEDENKTLNILNKIKNIAIFIIVLGLILVFGYKFLGSTNKNKLENYLKKQGYVENNNVWSKEEKDTTSTINYTYNSNINKLTKERNSNYTNYQEQVRVKYNGAKTIEINYSYNDGKCLLVQTGTYDYTKDKFDCKVDYTSNDCTLKCNILKKEGESFSKELNEIMKNSGTNKNFLVKNKD